MGGRSSDYCEESRAWQRKREWEGSDLCSEFKQNLNSDKIGLKHIKGSKERYLLGQQHNLHIFGVIPFIKLQNDA